MAITYLDEEQRGSKITYLDEEPSVKSIEKIKKRPDLIYSLSGTTPEKLARSGAEAESKGQRLRANILYGGAALQSAGRDILTIPAHFFNQALLNYPRSIARTAGFEYPEKAENKIIETVAKGAGIAGAITSPATRLLAKFGFAPAGAKLGEKVVRGAASGVVAGGVFAPSEDVVGLKERGQTAAVGGILGALSPLAIGGVKKIPKGMHKMVQTFKVLRGPNQAQIKANVSKIESELGVSKSIAQRTKLGLTSQKITQEETLNQHINEAKDMFAENKQLLTKQLDTAVNTGTKNTRQILREMNNASSQTYGNALEAISDDLVSSGRQMTRGEFLGIYQNTLQKAQEGALPASRMGSALDKIARQFGISVDNAGNLIADESDKAINFKDLIGSIKTMRKGLSGNFKQGTGATPEDIVFDIFQDEYGKWVAEKVPAFAKLQSEYAPIAELKRQAGRIFKPYDTGEYKTSQAVGLLKKFGLAREGDKQGEKRLLTAIEKGFELQGQKIGGAKGLFTDIESLGQTMGELAKEKEYVVNVLQQRLKEMKFSNQSQRLAVENELANRVEKLTAQKLTESINLKNRADADRLIKWLLGAGLAYAGIKTPGAIGRLTEH